MESEGKITVKAAVISHIGNIRTNNEDNFFLDGTFMAYDQVNDGFRAELEKTAPFHLFGICDGMGGLEGGERASFIGVSEMKPLYASMEDDEIENRIREYAMKATERVLADAEENGKSQKEGTTMVLLYLHGKRGTVANIGDSRAYLLRDGHLTQISRDHSQVFQLMLQGKLTREQMRKHPRANAITHYIGIPKERINEQYIRYGTVELKSGDRFLLCSDGLSDLMSFEKIEEMLSSEDGPLPVTERLVLEALELGGKDNTTAMVIDISGEHFSECGGLPGMDETDPENAPTLN